MRRPTRASGMVASSRPSVRERLLATRSARFAAAVLALFVSAAILAPLVANDRPYLLVAIDTGRYEAARTSLVAVVQTWADLRAHGESDWLAHRPAGSTRTYARALAEEWSAVTTRVRTLRAYLDPRDASVLEAFEGRESAYLDDHPQLAVTTASEAARTLEPAPAGESATPRGSTLPPGARRTVELRATSSTPLFASMTPLDAGLVVAWIVFVLATFVWRSSRLRFVVAALVAIAAAAMWRPLVGNDVGPASIKRAMDHGDLVVERAWFPPIPMGFAETNLAEAFRPPTWLASSQLMPEGGYAHPRGGDARFAALAVPVHVASAEPALNAWHRHLLGTDSLGRDLLARVLWGARSSLLVGFASAVLLTLLGVALGLLAGWCGGLVDVAVSRTIELVLCFPAFVLVLCAMFFVDPRRVPPLVSVAVVIGIVGWTGVARLVRAECLRLRELEFVAAARALGIGETRIVWRHVLPNAIGPAIIAFSFAIGSAILTESALSFLGFGVQIPVPSWGSLVSDTGSNPDHAWIWIFPGLCIFATVAGSNLLGEALRDALDPRHGR
jgi:peptide/nickel transport system permease protein